MSLIYVTGVAGSGKSAVCKELIARGYEAYDTDKDGFTGWINKETGEEVNPPREEWDKRTTEWYGQHDWRTSIIRVKELADRANTKTIFLCGSSENKNEIMQISDMTITLEVDEETLKERIAVRTNPFGKQPHELEMILEHRKNVLEQNKSNGTKIIDSTQPIDKVVGDIIGLAKKLPQKQF